MTQQHLDAPSSCKVETSSCILPPGNAKSYNIYPQVCTLSLRQDEMQDLEQWLQKHGGFLHPRINISHNEDRGLHWTAKAAIESATPVSTIPHSLALSYLNALVDDAYPVFKQRQKDFGGVENIGFFYLMAQYIHQDSSFWKPYLDVLPKPAHAFTTPLWFDESEDLVWLEGTDVLHTMLGRKAIYEQHHRKGVNILKQAGVDAKFYSWDLYRWAVTIFTSRSFSSRAIAPQESKFWTTHKDGPQGRRQTVLLDMSRTSATDLDFPVLFPVQDLPNHSHDARVDWSFDPGRFSITVTDPIEEGVEVFNNYGTKGNDELLLGYGFCIPHNPHDSVRLTLKPPPQELQMQLKKVHSGYFKTEDGSWNSERATFRIRQPTASMATEPEQVFNELPEALLELLTYILRHERGLPFTLIEQPRHYLKCSDGKRYLPHIARMIVQSLAPKLATLQAVDLPSSPGNEKQRQASIYRTSQMDILRPATALLRSFTRSLLRRASEPGSRFVTLEDFMELWSYRSPKSERSVPKFLQGIQANAGTLDVNQLRTAGWEEDVFVLAICAAVLEGDEWSRHALPEYIPVHQQAFEQSSANGASDAEEGLREHANSLMGIVQTARATAGSTVWADPRWSPAFIAVMGRILLYDSMMMMMIPDGEKGSEEARLVVYVHARVDGN